MTDPSAYDPDRAADLSDDAIAVALGERPRRTFVAVISSEAEMLRWARESGPEGAVVAAQYQMGLRDRCGTPWLIDPEHGMAFSELLHPKVPPIRAGRQYLAGTLALLDTLPGELAAEWPDLVYGDDGLAGGIVTRVSSGVAGIEWTIVTFYVVRTDQWRAELMRKLIEAYDARWSLADAELVAAYRERCRTLERRVRATFLPLGPRARTVEGKAVDVTAGGALLVTVEDDRKVPLQIADIGKMEYLDEYGQVEKSESKSSLLEGWPFGSDILPPSGPGWTP